MRAALCFSGRATKGSKATIANLKKYFITPLQELGYEVDCYAHFWKIQDWQEAIYALGDLLVGLKVEENDAEKLQQPWGQHYPDIQLYPYTGNMFYSIYQAHTLMKNSGKWYDLVARMRTDNVCTEGSYKEELRKCIGAKPNQIFFPRNYKMKGTVPHPMFWYVVDNFAIGGVEALDAYANTFWEVTNILRFGKKLWPEKKSWACGTLLGSTLVGYGIDRRLTLEPGVTVVRTWDAWLEKQVRRGAPLTEPAKEWLAAKKEMGMDDWSFKANRS